MNNEFCKNKINPHVFDWNSIKKSNQLFIVDWDELDNQFKKEGMYEKI